MSDIFPYIKGVPQAWCPTSQYEPNHVERADAARKARGEPPVLAEANSDRGRCTECKRPTYKLFGKWYHVDAAIDVHHHGAKAA